MKTKQYLLLLTTCIITLSINAQDHGNREISNKLRALDALIGDWEGEGYIMDQRTREKNTFTQTEKIRYDLDSTIITIRGVGKSDGNIKHDARAIISPSDSAANEFEFYSFLANGRKGKFIMKKEGDLIKWFIDVPQGKVRYTITLSENTYHEIGEFGRGDQWFPFMEMNLVRVAGDE